MGTERAPRVRRRVARGGGSRAAVKPRRKEDAPPGRRRKWRDRAARFWRIAQAIPPSIRTLILLLLLAAGVVGANIIHWVIRKPTELLLPVSDVFIKTPAATWKTYGPLFLRFSTAAITPELLAALAQVESAGNPAAHTYWRWNRAASDFFGIYRPASSSVGMYQMTDAAYADAQHYCIRQHSVMEAGPGSCGDDGGYLRLIPGNAVELTAILLDRGVAAVLRGQHDKTATIQQKQDLAAMIHLCGAGPARGFAQRGFRLPPGERCGDHDPADYLAQVNAMEQRFRRLASED